MAQLNKQQIKNLQKRMRLANLTTGEEREAHMREIDRLIIKYNLVVPDDRLIEEEHVTDYKKALNKTF